MNSALLSLEHEMYDDPDIFMLECSEWEYNIQMEQADFMLEMVEFKEEQNFKRSKLKIYSENGTDEDLQFLYDQIVTESEGEKKGIFATIWKGICDIFQAISTSISNVISAITGGGKKVTVPKTYYDCAKNTFAKIKEYIPKILIAISVVTGIGGIVYAGKKIYDKHKERTGQIEDKSGNDQNGDKLAEKAGQKLLSAADQALLTAAEDKVTAINTALAVIEKNPDTAATVVVSCSELAETVKGVKEVSDKVTKTSNESWVAKAVKNSLAAPLISCVQKIASVGSKITKTLLEKLSSAKDKVSKAANDVKDKVKGKKSDADDGVERLSGEVVNASAEDDTEGDATFEAGSLDDVMALIADL